MLVFSYSEILAIFALWALVVVFTVFEAMVEFGILLCDVLLLNRLVHLSYHLPCDVGKETFSKPATMLSCKWMGLLKQSLPHGEVAPLLVFISVPVFPILFPLFIIL